MCNLVWYLSIVLLTLRWGDIENTVYVAQNFGRENSGRFGKMIIICQYFTQPNSRCSIVTNGSYCKFTNVFLAKILNDQFTKVLPRQHFVLHGSLLWEVCYPQNWEIIKSPSPLLWTLGIINMICRRAITIIMVAAYRLITVCMSEKTSSYMAKQQVVSKCLQVRTSRVESGSDDLDNLCHFLEGQVGLICKLNYLDVTRSWHLLSEWVKFGSDECTKISLVWN